MKDDERRKKKKPEGYIDLFADDDEEEAPSVGSLFDDDDEDEPAAEDDPVEPFVPPEDDNTTDPDQSETKEKPESGEAVDDKGAEAASTENGKEVVVNNIVETIEKDLELDDYRSLLRKISTIAETTQKCLVTVSGISSRKSRVRCPAVRCSASPSPGPW